MVFQSVQTPIPGGRVGRQPSVDLSKRSGVEPVNAVSPFPVNPYETGCGEPVEVLRHSLTAHVERLGKLAQCRGTALTETFEEVSSGRIGDGFENVHGPLCNH